MRRVVDADVAVHPQPTADVTMSLASTEAVQADPGKLIATLDPVLQKFVRDFKHKMLDRLGTLVKHKDLQKSYAEKLHTHFQKEAAFAWQ